MCACVGGTAHIAHGAIPGPIYTARGSSQGLPGTIPWCSRWWRAGSSQASRPSATPRKNLITKALGVEPEVEGDYHLCGSAAGGYPAALQRRPVRRGAGWGLEQILGHTPVFITPRKLIEQALQAGSQDNVTALVIGVEPTEE